MAALGIVNKHIEPTPSGDLDSRYEDGDDGGGGVAPSAPVLGTPVATGTTSIDVPLLTASTGPSTPITYAMEVSSSGPTTGFSEFSTGDIFAGDGTESVTSLTQGTTYWFRAKAIGADLQVSAYSEVVSATTASTAADTESPTTPTGLTLTNITSSSITPTWNASTDNVGVSGYDVLRGIGDGAGNPVGSGTIIATVTETSYQDNNLDDLQEYYYRIKARDAAGNVSANTSRVFGTTTAGSSDPAATYVVQADGSGGAYTTVQAAISAAVAAGASDKIIEIRANTPGATQVLAQTIDLTNVQGTSGHPLIIRVRSGDTIRFRTSGNLLVFSNSAYIEIQGHASDVNSFQLGDPADFVHNAVNSYESCYPQTRGIYATGSSHHITLRRIRFTGARSYVANEIDETCSDFVFEDMYGLNHGTNHYDINPSTGQQQDWGDLIDIHGTRHKLLRCSSTHGGHDGWVLNASYSIARDGDFSGYWADISPSAGSRATSANGSKYLDSPFGPVLFEGCIVRDSGNSVDETGQALLKNQTSHMIMRGMYFFDSDSHLWHSNFSGAVSGGGKMSNECIYHNTSYVSRGTWWNNTSSYTTGQGQNNYENNRVQNNLFQQVSDNDKNVTSPANVVRYATNWTSGTLNGYPNGFHGSLFKGNLYGGPGAQRVALLTVSGGGSANFVIDSPPGALSSNVMQNVVGSATFLDVGTPRNRTKAGFVVTAWPTGTAAGDAPALTTTTSGKSNSTLLDVEWSRAFYDGWGIAGEVGDYLYIGANVAAAIAAGPSQISSINYSTHRITLATARTWSSGDGVWFGGNAANGSANIWDNRGAAQ